MAWVVVAVDSLISSPHWKRAAGLARRRKATCRIYQQRAAGWKTGADEEVQEPAPAQTNEMEPVAAAGPAVGSISADRRSGHPLVARRGWA